MKMKTNTDELKCSICRKNVKAVYKLNNNLVCLKCYDDIFKDANPAKVTKYLKYLDKQIVNMSEMLDDYHNMCVDYENYCDSMEEKHIEDLNDIKELVSMYCKGIGLDIYNKHIKPILEHIDYIIYKVKEDEKD